MEKQVDACDGREATRLRDGLDWEVIAEQHGSRNCTQCYEKWYKELGVARRGRVGAGQPERRPYEEVWDGARDKELLQSMWRSKPCYVRPRASRAAHPSATLVAALSHAGVDGL